MGRRTSVIGILAVAMLVAGCGGGSGGTAATAPDGGSATSAPTAAVDGQPSADTPAASAGAAPSTASGGGAAGGGVCDLATNDELAAIFAVAAVNSSVVTGPPDSCIVESGDGAPLASWVLTTTGGEAVYDAVAQGDQATSVESIGDRAAFVDNMGLLVVKDEVLLTVVIAAGAGLSEEAGQAAAKAIATKAVGRM